MPAQALIWRQIHKSPQSFETYATLDSESLSQRVRLVLRVCHSQWHLYVHNAATRTASYPVRLPNDARTVLDAQLAVERTITRAGLSLISEGNT